MLDVAIRDGAVVRGRGVNAGTFPQSARTYLADGTGLAWSVPERLRGGPATFVVDAEIIAPVRASLVRRFGVDDPVDFAERWTRAEALAKLADVPIITWLGRHGLDLPADAVATARGTRGVVAGALVAWHTSHDAGVVLTRAAAMPSEG